MALLCHIPELFDVTGGKSNLIVNIAYIPYFNWSSSLANTWFVETCRSVIICEIIVHFLFIVQNKKISIKFPFKEQMERCFYVPHSPLCRDT